MGSFVLGARIVLSVVFATAGAAKLADLRGSRAALMEFGVAARIVPVAAVLLPLAELATAIALVPSSTASWGAVAAAALLLAFAAGIARALSRGEAPDCHCFGQLHSAPAGRATLARNLGLALLALAVVWQGPGPAVDDWWAARTAAELAAVGGGVAAAVLAALAFRLWRENRDIRRDLVTVREELAFFPPGLPVGAVAPGFALTSAEGDTVTLESLCARGRPVLLVFISPTCGPCWVMLPQLRQWQERLAGRLTIAVLSNGTLEENLDMVEERGIAGVLLQDKWEVHKAYRVQATPSAVVVSPDGRIASTTVQSSRPIEPLIRLTLQRETSQAAQSPPVAQQAP